MKLLAIDYGDVRTGLARCDALGMLASPIGFIKEAYQPRLIEKLMEVMEKERPERILIGLPRNMDGSEGFRAEKCRAFGGDLERACGVPVTFVDERLTTVRAHQMLSEANASGKKRKERVDALSAVLILQAYLDSGKSD